MDAEQIVEVLKKTEEIEKLEKKLGQLYKEVAQIAMEKKK